MIINSPRLAVMLRALWGRSIAQFRLIKSIPAKTNNTNEITFHISKNYTK